jgi:hypothetical protein
MSKKIETMHRTEPAPEVDSWMPKPLDPRGWYYKTSTSNGWVGPFETEDAAKLAAL